MWLRMDSKKQLAFGSTTGKDGDFTELQAVSIGQEIID